MGHFLQGEGCFFTAKMQRENQAFFRKKRENYFGRKTPIAKQRRPQRQK
jgi:hypothetical protein